MLEAVIFDFDGVVADTLSYYFRHMRSILKAHRQQITDAEITNLVGKKFSEEFALLSMTYGLKIPASVFREEAYVLSLEEMYRTLRLDPYLKGFLLDLKARDIVAGIASNSPRRIIISVLDRLELNGFFPVIVTGDDVRSYKPFPEVYMKAVELLGKKARNCVAIEDTSIGLEAAVSAGLKTIAIPGEHTRHQDFSKAHLVVTSFKELTVEKLVGLLH